MMVIAVNNGPPRLRGRLSLWLVEVRAGIYVGEYSRKTRERIWEEVVSFIEDGDAVIAYSAPTDNGMKFETCGSDRRIPVDLDGLEVVMFSNPVDASPVG
jgi:CRISPR-associated protein Cas2